MYSREEEFWRQRLAAAKAKKRPGSAGPGIWNDGASTADSIPAYQPPRLAASPPRLPLLEAVQQPSTGLVPMGGPTRGAAAATAVPSAADGLVQAAQMEALKLQVAQLRKSNAALQQQLAGANAARAAAPKQAALNQLSLLALEPVTAEGTAPHEAHAAAADALLGELGALLPPGRDAVPLAYVQQLHASYMQRLEEQQQRHADALAAQAEEVQARLQRQADRHAQEVRLLTERLEDEAREAEVQLLRDDCRYLKEKLQQLGAEYERRVQVAAAEARLTAQREAAEQRRSMEVAAREQLHSCQAQLAEARAAAPAAAAAKGAEAATTLERASHAMEMAHLCEQQAGELGRVRQGCTDSLAQREAEHNTFLDEQGCLQADASAVPSHAGAQHAAGSWQPGAAPSVTPQPKHQQSWQLLRPQWRSPTPPPGQLMELASDEDDEQSNGGMQQRHQHRGERARLAPSFLQHP